MDSFVKIKGKIQNYQWGGFHFIPQLLSVNAQTNEPNAEYWLGSHPSAISLIEQTNEGVDVFLQKQGASPLKFLFKILDVKEMLSIQSHPTKAQAEQGFAKENSLGIDLKAANRNYKDESDKPELMVALSPFWLLHGLKTADEIENTLREKPYLEPILRVLREEGLSNALEFALQKDDNVIKTIQAHLTEDCRVTTKKYSKHSIYYWICHWLNKNPDAVNGILTLFFLNIVKLEEGQAIYQPAGLLHAYLEGQNVELMANSDNVLRAGLTPKHIDVKELLSTCLTEPTQPNDYLIKQRQSPSKAIEYPTPFEAFQLEALNSEISQQYTWSTLNPEILFCYAGSAEVEDKNKKSIKLQKGESLLILPNSSVTVNMVSAKIFKAKNI